MVPPPTGPLRETAEKQQDAPPEDNHPGPGRGRPPERDRGGGRGHAADDPEIETEGWILQNSLDHRNSLECQIQITEELMENPDSTRENHHLIPDRILIIL